MKIKTIFKYIVSLFLALILFVIFFYNSNLKSISDDTTQIKFIVDEGTSASNVVVNLEEQGLIKSSLVAKVYLKLNDSDIKSGEFLLNKAMDLKTIINYLSDSSNIITNEVDITLIEGYWLKHMADEISKKTTVSADELLALWNDKDTIKELMNEYKFLTDDILNQELRYSLEGYLFPETYRFYVETTALDITKKMLDKTNEVYLKYKDQIDNSELSIHELFTLASIVQYESKSVEDMHNIAQVFYNRIDIDMKLQSSVTVCYAKNIADNWKACETTPDYDSPYNTYKISGLPIGPVTSFSDAALNATLNPKLNDYLYFVADVYGDGAVYYAKTHDEHLSNVKKFNLEF